MGGLYVRLNMFGLKKKYKEPNWEESFNTLLHAVTKSILDFTSQFPDKKVADLFFDCEPDAGYALISYNSVENSNNHFKEHYEERTTYIHKQVTERYDNWEDSFHSFLKRESKSFRCGDPGYFDYQHFAEVEFPEWVEYLNQDLPNRPNYQDDYLESRISFLFWKVLDRLIKDGAFEALSTCANFRMGYCYHDQEPVTLFIINHKELE